MVIYVINGSKISYHSHIIVPIIIIGLIVGIWFYKNAPQKIEETRMESQSSEISEKSSLPEETAIEETETEELSSMVGYFALHETEKIDLEELKSYGLPILIDFGADSCIPCKEMAPVLTKLNEELAGKAIILFVDVWKYQELMTGFPVEVIPTQILIDAAGNPYMPSENTTIQFVQYGYEDTGEIAYTAHQGGLTDDQALTILYEMGMAE